METCYRHPNRETGVSCSNCGRPICPDCMTPTTVGMRCPECSKDRTRVVNMRNLASVPRVTYTLIGVNVVAFLAEQGQFTISGAARGALITNGWIDRFDIHINHQYWRLITNGFLHENILHIAFNMYLLYLLGLMLEPAIGSVRFGAAYFTSLLAGSAGALIATPGASIGASGAIFGLMGVAVVELRSRNIGVMQSGIGGLILINLVFSFTFPGISIGDHIGGLIGGLLAGVALKAGDRYHSRALGLAGCAAISVISVALGLLAAGSTSTGIGL